MICCLLCRRKLPTVHGLRVHLGRMHRIRGVSAETLMRQQQARHVPCLYCAHTFTAGRGLGVHLAHAHEVYSPRPHTDANRRARGIVRATEPLAALPAGPGPILLLEAVIALAAHDARTDRDAAAWLDDVRRGIAH